jgi:hypothetical protein
MTVIRLGAIVEGHGEAKALPILLHRIARQWDAQVTLVVGHVSRVPSSSLKRAGYLEAEIENVVRKLGRNSGILVLLDCDGDSECPKFDGPAWLERARRARPDVSIGLALAYKEYEAWFIASAESLRGHCGLPENLTAPADPEAIKGAKGWLSRHMPPNRPYAETVDQPALTRLFDLDSARKAPSFDKCYREVICLLNAVRAKTR